MRLVRLLFRPHLWKFHLDKIISAYKGNGIQGVTFVFLSNLFPKKLNKNYLIWLKISETLSSTDLKQISRKIKDFNYKPLISIFLTSQNIADKYIAETLVSVLSQIYKNWELCLIEDDKLSLQSLNIIKSFCSRDKRIKIFTFDPHTAFTSKLNFTLSQCNGEYVGFLNGNDLLAKTALYHVVKTLNLFPEADLLYTDEDQITSKNKRQRPIFKSAWDPVLILSSNYVNNFSVFRKKILTEIDVDKECEVNSDYNLLLNFIEKIPAKNIKHIPKILYHERCDNSLLNSSSQKDNSSQPVELHLSRKKLLFDIKHYAENKWRISFSLPQVLPKISIILPTKDRLDLLKVAVDSLLDPNLTDYENFELFVVNNNSMEPQTYDYFSQIQKDKRVKVVDYKSNFNWSKINNFAEELSNGEHILLLNNDIEPINKDWLREMVSYFALPEVGIVGAKLYYPDKTIQHAGVVLGMGFAAGHILAGSKADINNYQCRQALDLPRNCSAVTGACMLVRRTLYKELKGFDSKLRVALNDIEFCIRAIKLGYSIVWTPFAELFHYESATRGKHSDLNRRNFARFNKEVNYVKSLHSDLIENDPFYNPNFDLKSNGFDLSYSPRISKI